MKIQTESIALEMEMSKELCQKITKENENLNLSQKNSFLDDWLCESLKTEDIQDLKFQKKKLI